MLFVRSTAWKCERSERRESAGLEVVVGKEAVLREVRQCDVGFGIAGDHQRRPDELRQGIARLERCHPDLDAAADGHHLRQPQRRIQLEGITRAYDRAVRGEQEELRVRRQASGKHYEPEALVRSLDRAPFGRRDDRAHDVGNAAQGIEREVGAAHARRREIEVSGHRGPPRRRREARCADRQLDQTRGHARERVGTVCARRRRADPGEAHDRTRNGISRHPVPDRTGEAPRLRRPLKAGVDLADSPSATTTLETVSVRYSGWTISRSCTRRNKGESL